jgi:hypothetical protein
MSIVPFTNKTLEHMMTEKADLSSVGKIVLLGRIIKIKQLLNRSQVTLSDESGLMNIIVSSNQEEL